MESEEFVAPQGQHPEVGKEQSGLQGKHRDENPEWPQPERLACRKGVTLPARRGMMRL